MLTARLARTWFVALLLGSVSEASAQIRPVIEVFAASGANSMSTAARAVYDRAGGLQTSAGFGFALGLEATQLRVMAFYVGLPNTLDGVIESYDASRQLGGVRVDWRMPMPLRGWSFVPSIAVTGGSRPSVHVARQDDETLAPSSLSNDAVSWRAASARLLAGPSRDIGTRYTVRAAIGAELTFREGGQWTAFTTRPPATGTGFIAELGITMRRARRSR